MIEIGRVVTVILYYARASPPPKIPNLYIIIILFLWYFVVATLTWIVYDRDCRARDSVLNNNMQLNRSLSKYEQFNVVRFGPSRDGGRR